MMTTKYLQIQKLTCLYMTVILISSQSLAFKTMWTKSKKHQDITRDAILVTTADICRSQALKKGQVFILSEPLTVESVAAACSASDSAKDFKNSINKISHHNAWVDFWHVFHGRYHFDNEEFLAGRKLITDGISAVKRSVSKQSYGAAREKLGQILHTLQDFYSHSNWIELGKTEPYSNLIKPDTSLDNIADKKTETCRKCNSDVCITNILEEVNKRQILTSGYFGFSKPKGKCSHGGSFDLLSWREGGINKDDSKASHGYLHETAAAVATAATRELLQDIRAAVGDSEFLRLMGLSQTTVLCFVVDTTGSMSDDIAEVRSVASSIVDNRTGTSEYILVPFNDPEFGPLTRTTDPNKFKEKLNALTAHDGGDSPEMCLSGLQLALTRSPPKTEIFVFTDADAKDIWLLNTVKTLIQITKSKVNFMLTNGFSLSRRRRSSGSTDNQQQVSTRLLLTSHLTTPPNQVYQELAQVSGGQAIEVTKRTLAQATEIIAVTTRSTLVTLLQAVRNPAKAENFSVFVDSSVQNLTIYITGNSPKYTITSPSGASQSSTELNGALGLIEKVGNFHTVKPNISDQTGQWFFSINSTQPYTIRVVGYSGVDFLFDFVELSQGPHPSYTVLNSRPAANTNITLLVSMVGGDSVTPTGVSLVEATRTNSFNGILEDVDSGQYLVTFTTIPAGGFTVRVTGQISSTRSVNDSFQRQSPTQFQASTVTLTTEPDGTMEPGKLFTLPFTVATNGSGGAFSISVSNDRNFDTQFNTSLILEHGGSANDTMTLLAPENTTSGTDVTVTIRAETPDGSDSNYAVLRLAVIAPVTDFTPPACEAVTTNLNCSGNCSLSSWYLTANVTDGNGSGVQSIRVLQGNGNLSTTTVLNDTGLNITMISYTSSCCSPDLELVAVDAVGNVATCFSTVRATTPNTTIITTTQDTANTSSTTPPTNQVTNNSRKLCLLMPVILWLNLGVALYQFIKL